MKSAILLLLLFAALAAGAQPFYRKPVAPVRNVIVMIPDGTSTSVLAAARWYKFYNDPSQRMLNLDSCLCGLVGTFSSDSPIPCSAPAMSAYMTGMPQQAGNVSVYPAANPAQDIVEVESGRACQPLATLLEAAKHDRGKATGLVVTADFCHATPAACAAHHYSRHAYPALAAQMAGNDLDVMFGGGVDSIEVYSDYLEPYVSPETERIPELYLSSDGIWTPFSVLPVVMIYNTKLIDDGAITAWRDLMRPGYRGKIAFADPSVSGSSFTALVTLLQALGGDPDEELLAFAENLGGLELDSSGDVLTAVANGSCWIGITLEETALKRRDAGDSIELAYPEDGTSLVPDGTAIVRGARHPDNARRFIDFTVSRDVQQLLTVQYRRPVRTDVALGSLPEVEQLSVLDYDIPWASEHHDEVLMSWAFYLDREERP